MFRNLLFYYKYGLKVRNKQWARLCFPHRLIVQEALVQCFQSMIPTPADIYRDCWLVVFIWATALRWLSQKRWFRSILVYKNWMHFFGIRTKARIRKAEWLKGRFPEGWRRQFISQSGRLMMKFGRDFFHVVSFRFDVSCYLVCHTMIVVFLRNMKWQI